MKNESAAAKFLTLLLVCASVGSVSLARAEPRIECAIDDKIRKEALKLNWDEFDQQEKSFASFRQFALRGCFREAAELIEYYLENKTGLDMSQQRNSRFHAGQMYGHAGDEQRALELIRSAHWPEQPVNNPLDWNTYVEGIVAFFEKQLPVLTAARARLEQAGGRNLINAGVLKRMERCLDKSYDDIWKPACAG